LEKTWEKTYRSKSSSTLERDAYARLRARDACKRGFSSVSSARGRRASALSGRSGRSSCGRACAVSGEGVDHECEADEIEVLALVADAVGASEPQTVIEATVDALGIVTATIQPREVRVAGGDGPDVLGPVELAAGVVVGSMQPDGDGPAAEVVGELIVVVPPVLPIGVTVAVRVDAFEWSEVQVAGIGEDPDPVGAGKAFGRAMCIADGDVGSCGGGVGAPKLTLPVLGWPLSVGQAVWRYSLMSPLQVWCRRIGRPGRCATTS